MREEALRKLASAASDFASRKVSMEEQATRAVALERAKLEDLSIRHETYVREATAAKEKVEADAARLLQVSAMFFDANILYKRYTPSFCPHLTGNRKRVRKTTCSRALSV